jgi:ATP-grasp domain
VNQSPKPDAFVLTGAFWVVVRDPVYLAELSRRGLKILLITAARWRTAALECVNDPGHPASAIAEVGFVAGGVDTEGSFTPGVIAVAQGWRERYDVVGLYAVGETMVEPTGLLADAFGLPSPGLRASRACRSKYLQRFYLPELSPALVVLPAGAHDTADLDAIGFPAVVKPSGRHSSLGVEAVRDRAELDTALTTFPEHETVLVERQVTGPEFSVESLVQDGKIVFASVTHKVTTESHARTFVELTHTIPCGQSDAEETLLRANERVLDRLAFENGITHTEFRIDEHGRPILMEIAARTPGDGIMTLYRLATGVALEPEIIRVALGQPAAYPAPRRYARQVYLEHEPGVLTDVTVDWPDVEPTWIGPAGLWPELTAAPADPPTLRAVLVIKSRGHTLGPLRSSNDRAVTFFIDAPTLPELDSLNQRVRSSITVHTGPELPGR